MERFFSDHRKVQVRFPNLPDILKVLEKRNIIAPPSDDWFDEANARGFGVKALARWMQRALVLSSPPPSRGARGARGTRGTRGAAACGKGIRSLRRLPVRF